MEKTTAVTQMPRVLVTLPFVYWTRVKVCDDIYNFSFDSPVPSVPADLFGYVSIGDCDSDADCNVSCWYSYDVCEELCVLQKGSNFFQLSVSRWLIQRREFTQHLSAIKGLALKRFLVALETVPQAQTTVQIVLLQRLCSWLAAMEGWWDYAKVCSEYWSKNNGTLPPPLLKSIRCLIAGDCDNDDECEGNLLCFERQGTTGDLPVPGCEGGASPKLLYRCHWIITISDLVCHHSHAVGVTDKDYCYDPNAPTAAPTLPQPSISPTTPQPSSAPNTKPTMKPTYAPRGDHWGSDA